MKKIISLSVLLIFTKVLCAQDFLKGFTPLEGKSYCQMPGKSGDRKANLGDMIQYHIRFALAKNDSVIFDSHREYGTQVANIAPGAFKGDIPSGLTKMAKGDSASFLIPADSLYKGQFPPFAKSGDYMKFSIKITNVWTKAEYDAYQKAESQKQSQVDDAELTKYFEASGIKPTKTASGLYYVITTPGSGPNAKAGNKVSVNYTGKLLGGKTFDSNVNPQFGHVQPFEFDLGKHNVIAGWDEGIALLNKGAKATLYIPSGLAYGPRAQGADIPANSVLVFDVELVDNDVKPAPKVDEEAALQSYFATNKITPLKTASGLYYKITQPGTGELAKAGQTVSVNYTGMLLNGEKFDSNVLPEFGHVQAFEFPLGQGRVIKGWDEGIALLNKGAKATLYIPSKLGYGAQGAGGKIPPDATLIFEVELVNAK